MMIMMIIFADDGEAGKEWPHLAQDLPYPVRLVNPHFWQFKEPGIVLSFLHEMRRSARVNARRPDSRIPGQSKLTPHSMGNYP